MLPTAPMLRSTTRPASHDDPCAKMEKTHSPTHSITSVNPGCQPDRRLPERTIKETPLTINSEVEEEFEAETKPLVTALKHLLNAMSCPQLKRPLHKLEEDAQSNIYLLRSYYKERFTVFSAQKRSPAICDITLSALKRLIERHCAQQPLSQEQKKTFERTLWLNFSEPNKEDPHGLPAFQERILEKLQSPPKQTERWTPVVMSLDKHFLFACMGWKDQNLSFVLTGSLGHNMYVEQKDAFLGRKIKYQDFTVDLAQKKFFSILQAEIRTAFRIYDNQHGNTSPPPETRIYFLEARRQFSYFSCGEFVFNDFFAFLDSNDSSGIEGREVLPVSGCRRHQTGKESKDDTFSLSAIREPGIHHYVLTRYPILLLLPTQSLTVLEAELEKIQKMEPEKSTGVLQLREALTPWIKKAPQPTGGFKDINTYAIHHFIKHAIELAEMPR